MTSPRVISSDRLESWKEIAAFLKRGTRTVQRWEREEGLPVYRLAHEKLGSVYAYAAELEAWRSKRGCEGAAVGAGAAAGPRVAVLPLADMSPEKDESQFCEGLAEEIVHALGHIAGLRVASGRSPLPAGRRRDVEALVEGSVRKQGDKLRITVQLTAASNGFQLWTERFDRTTGDSFKAEEEIAAHVASALETNLARHDDETARSRPPTTDLRAWECYLRGRRFYYQYSPRNVRFALQLFTRAVEIESGFARAWAGIADCWSYLYLYAGREENARRDADRASARATGLDPRSAEAQAARGLSLSLDGRDEEAECAFETAIALGPDLFDAHYFYARHAFALGRPRLAALHFEAAMEARKDDYQAPLLVAQVYEDLGRPADAAAARRRGIQAAERHAELNPDDTRALYMAANGLVALGENQRGTELIERALAIQPDDAMLLYNAGCVFSMMGRGEAAFDCLEQAAARGLRQRGWYEHDRNLDALRPHPRFQKLLESL